MFKTTHTSSWMAFRNHCEYACPLDIQRKSYAKEKWLAFLLYVFLLILWSW